MKPHVKLKVAAEAFTAGSRSHPDMRRWDPYPGSADADLLPEQGTIRSRSRDLSRNHGVAEGVGQTYVDNIVGTGLRLKSRPVWKALKLLDSKWTEDYAEEWSNLIESRWCAYAESKWFDAARSINFHGQTNQVLRSGFVNGEALALPLWLPAPGAPAATCFQLLDPDRLDNPNHQPNRDDLRGGIEIDQYGAPIAYWILKSHPGDAYFGSHYDLSGFAADAARIPAYTPWGRARVLHIHDKERNEQRRGKPGLTSVLRQFKVLGDYSNAELKAAVNNAKVALITEGIFSQEQLLELLSDHTDVKTQFLNSISQRGRASVSMNDGLIVPLQIGEKLSSFTPSRPSAAFEAFTLTLFRHIAAGLNIPYELLLKDFSKTNYSSARAALLEAWRFFRGRRKWLVTYWCQPAFELWFEEEVMTGAIDAPDWYERRALYCRAKWIGDGRGWVDPLKEAQAAGERMNSFITTLEDECAEQGADWEENIETAGRIKKRMLGAGLWAPWMADGPSQRPPVPALPPPPDEKEEIA